MQEADTQAEWLGESPVILFNPSYKPYKTMWKVKYTNESGELCSVEDLHEMDELLMELRFIVNQGASVIVITKEN